MSSPATKRSTAPRKVSTQGRSTRTQKPPHAASGTRDGILAAARASLVRDGYQQLTTRRVAELAGITVGNLTYHFPSKRELLRALIQRLVAEYDAGIESFFADQSLPPDQQFRAVIEWLMSDSVVPVSNRIFRELWAMALHDPYLARAVDDFYDEAIQRISHLLCRAHPALAKSSANVIAHLVATISEGTGIIYGTRRNRASSHAATMALAMDVLTDAVRKAAAVR